MLFSRQKKLQRDRDAGLVFCWRGGNSGNRGGLLIALILTSVLFAAAFLGISLNFKGAKAEPKQSAKILMLDEISSEMALWIDQNSPFPSRWDPKNDKAHQERVSSLLAAVFQDMSVPSSPWKSMPEVEQVVFSPRLIEQGMVQLGTLPKSSKAVNNAGVFELVVAMDAHGGFKKRLPDSVSDIEIQIPMQEYGSSLRFAIAVDAAGSVIYCAPIEWEASDYAKNIENWVRLQRFKPSQKSGEQVGEIVVRVGVKNHAGN